MPANRFSYVTPPGTESRVVPYWPEVERVLQVMCAGFVAAEAFAHYEARSRKEPHNPAMAKYWENAMREAITAAFPTWSDVPIGYRITAP